MSFDLFYVKHTREYIGKDLNQGSRLPSLKPGLYCLVDESAAGKSLHLRALFHSYAGSWLTIKEPDAPLNLSQTKYLPSETVVAGLLTELYEGSYLATPQKFREALAKPDSMTNKAFKNNLVFVDSLSGYFRNSSFGPGAKGGLTQGNADFLEFINNWCSYNTACIFSVINSDLIPSPMALKGLTAAHIVVEKSGVLNWLDRVTRKHTRIFVTDIAMQLACDDFGYGKYSECKFF